MEPMQAQEGGMGRRTAKERPGSTGHGLSNLQEDLSRDLREVATSLALYCDLLAAPDVLNAEYSHYAQELRCVAQACRALLRKASNLDAHQPCRYASLCTHFENLVSPRC